MARHSPVGKNREKNHGNCFSRHDDSHCFSKPCRKCRGRAGRERALQLLLLVKLQRRFFSQAALIADNQGVLNGTTYSGGSAGSGTVFKLTPPARGQTAWKETVLYSFAGGSDGRSPNTGLIADKGALYGTTTSGGSGTHQGGTVFKLTLRKTLSEEN
jgi:uncharacterized repeat protein (TIGR03803 family)